MCCSSGLFVGKVGRLMSSVAKSFTPTDATAFADDDVMRTSSLAFDCIVREPGMTGQVVEVVLFEQSPTPLKLPIRLYLMSSERTGLVVQDPYSAPGTITDILGVIDIDTADYIDIDSTTAMARVQASVNVTLPGSTLYIDPVAKGAGTYAAASTLTIQTRVNSD